jgi:hypothetical protein
LMTSPDDVTHAGTCTKPYATAPTLNNSQTLRLSCHPTPLSSTLGPCPYFNRMAFTTRHGITSRCGSHQATICPPRKVALAKRTRRLLVPAASGNGTRLRASCTAQTCLVKGGMMPGSPILRPTLLIPMQTRKCLKRRRIGMTTT